MQVPYHTPALINLASVVLHGNALHLLFCHVTSTWPWLRVLCTNCFEQSLNCAQLCQAVAILLPAQPD
jgi:hypothetical protein